MIYLHTKFYTRSSNGLLIIVIEPKLNIRSRFHAAAMLLFYILQKAQKVYIFLRCYHRHNYILNWRNMATTSQVRALAMLLLPVV
jgi:hypothetical protein